MSTAIDVETPRAPETPTETPTTGADASKPLSNGGGGGGGDNTVRSIIRKWKREDLLEKSAIALRALTCLFSAAAALVMATNKHGDWKEFNHYEEYRYVVAIGILGFLYTAVQLVRFGSGSAFIRKSVAGIADFTGDQITAYLLMSALSAAIPLTNRMREGADNMFTDASAASISMTFFAFVAIAISAMISGYKLSKQTYV